jgi:hypothetical protein
LPKAINWTILSIRAEMLLFFLKAKEGESLLSNFGAKKKIHLVFFSVKIELNL